MLAGLALLPLGLLLARSALEALLLAGAVVAVWIVELLNSAIEALADAVSLQDHPLIARAKDIGSAAVALTLLLAGAAWAAVLLPRVLVGGG